MSIVMILPMLPGLLATLYPTTTARPWTYPVPVLGQYGLMTAVLGGRTPAMMSFVIAGLACLAVAAVLVHIVTRLFRSERVIFGR